MGTFVIISIQYFALLINMKPKNAYRFCAGVSLFFILYGNYITIQQAARFLRTYYVAQQFLILEKQWRPYLPSSHGHHILSYWYY
jgi:phosphoglycerol transferase MdoB-like AlkP superfamily enzyme